jgi:hypothetical protein
MEQTSEARILYSPRGDASSEEELNVLATAYKFVLDCHVKKEAARSAASTNEAKGVEDARPARIILPR